MKKNFDDLPIAEQRVIIAQDLIDRLDAKKFVATAGTYLRVELSRHALANDDAQLRDVLANKKCRGCQIGGMFACAIDRHDALKIADVRNPGRMDDYEMREYLGRWFSRKTLEAVEDAFEGCGGYSDFRDSIPKDSDRMRLIAQNIIDNKGKFNGKQLLKQHTQGSRPNSRLSTAGRSVRLKVGFNRSTWNG